VVQPGQVMGTRGPGGDRDYALYAMLISPHGMRSLFIADRLPTLKEVNIAFAHLWQGLGHEQGYLLAELVDPVFLVMSTGPPASGKKSTRSDPSTRGPYRGP
jgi:hypothetical protein